MDGISFITYERQPVIQIKKIICIKILDNVILFKLRRDQVERWNFDNERKAEIAFDKIIENLSGIEV